MILLDERPHRLCRELDATNDRIILRLLQSERMLHELLTRYVGRWIFYRELCELQQKTIADERAVSARLRKQLREAREELACRMGVPRELR